MPRISTVTDMEDTLSISWQSREESNDSSQPQILYCYGPFVVYNDSEDISLSLSSSYISILIF